MTIFNTENSGRTSFVRKSELLREEFWQMPKYLLLADPYTELSNDARILYMLLKDRMRLSVQNQWFDDGNAYVVYSLEEIMATLHKAKPTCVKIKKELKSVELIEEKQVGVHKPNRIFVKVPSDEAIFTMQENYKKAYEIRKFKNFTSRGSNIELLEVQKLNGSNNYYSKNYMKDDDDRAHTRVISDPETEDKNTMIIFGVFRRFSGFLEMQESITTELCGAEDAYDQSEEMKYIFQTSLQDLSVSPNIVEWMLHMPDWDFENNVFNIVRRLTPPFGDKCDVENKPYYLTTSIQQRYYISHQS